MKTELSFNVTKGLFPEKTSSRNRKTPKQSKRKTPKQNICETNRLISWPLGQVVKTSPFHGGNMGSNPVGVTTSWGYSSAGRARALQARGHRFEPCCPHHIKKRATLCVVLFLCVGKQHRARTQPNGWRSAVACKRLRYAPCVTLQTLCVALLFILDLHYAEHALLSHVINCAFDQTNAFYLFVCLLLVYSFSPRVHSIPRGSPILKKAHQDDVLFLLYGTIYGREPNRTVDFRT